MDLNVSNLKLIRSHVALGTWLKWKEIIHDFGGGRRKYNNFEMSHLLKLTLYLKILFNEEQKLYFENKRWTKLAESYSIGSF
jgi:hypothetical protein